jgi:hypothetical protein
MIVGLSVCRARAHGCSGHQNFLLIRKRKNDEEKTENLINFFFWFRVGKFLRQSEKHKQKNKRIRSK